MSKNFLPGLLMLSFLALAALLSGLYLRQSVSSAPTATAVDIMQGHWSAGFEKAFGETLPVFAPSRSFWGNTEYRAFRQGRKGVVVGRDGWLFSDEELSCPSRFAANMAGNLDFIVRMRDTLAARNVRLVVALVPSKAVLYSDKLTLRGGLPACRRDVYPATGDALSKHDIPAPDLLAAFRTMRNVPPPASNTNAGDAGLYLKTDTHWTPYGADLAARTIARTQTDLLAELSLTPASAATVFKDAVPHEGDLLRYLPGVRDGMIRPDALPVAVTTLEGGGDLFGDSVPEIALVGTSYSANAKWNFDGFLKDALDADVLNMADQGLGPFTVMDRFLAGDAWRDAPPKLVIWEIPERYILFPHAIGNGQNAADHTKVF